MKDAVQKILTITYSILVPFAEGEQYNWSSEFVQTHAAKARARSAGVRVNFADLTDAEAELLGFPLWSEETRMRMIPLWLYRHIAFGQTLTCIDGTTLVVAPNYEEKGAEGYIDNDHRGGALAYGFIPTEAVSP